MIGLHEESSASPSSPPSAAPALTARIFAVHGTLQQGLGLEHRPGQEIMARAVADALEADTPLLFEAGTGVGKSLAYLVPGIIHAIDQRRQMIVSTHTISLQEQLDKKDLPLCRRLFQTAPETADYADFKSAVLLGKSNYLCTTRLSAALAHRQELLPSAEHAELQRIAAWADTSPEGLRHELSPPPLPEVWEHVSADSSACSRKHCDGERCFYQRARARLRQANVIIVNHSLLFALLHAGGAPGQQSPRGVLWANDFVVLDEAHTVPDVATEHFGLRISSYGVDRLLKHLYNPKTRRGVLQRFGSDSDRQLAADAQEASTQFFNAIVDRLLTPRSLVRVRDPDIVEPWLDAPLLALIRAVHRIADRFEDGRERTELLEQKTRLESYQAGLRQWLSVADEHLVYWAELTGKRRPIVALRAAPIDVAPLLRESLFRRQVAVICTSATLTAGGDLGPCQARLGADDAGQGLAPSPFDYARHMRVYIAADMPLPAAEDARIAITALIDYLRFCTLRVRGGSLVLFTSYADMRQCAQALAADYAQAGRSFYVQGEGLSRTELTRQFQAAGNGILFGTDSFWTGVDVPGPSLSQVVITRLPFSPPTHPILEARSDWIRLHGGQPFNELTLPDALVAFRQGIGRLIRHTQDRGIITLLDARVLTKSYGRLFLDCLPQRRHEQLTRENREALFRPFA